MRGVDVRSVVGAVVVLVIIGLVAFGVFYFFSIKPAAEELETSKIFAMSKVNELSSIGTSQAISGASAYSARIRAASSKVEVESILAEVNTSIQLERERKRLLGEASALATGAYYSATGGSGTRQAQELVLLLTDLQEEINSKTTIGELLEYESSGSMVSEATAAWRNLLTSIVSGTENDLLVMKRGLPASWRFITKADALEYIAGSAWQTLRELDFEGTTYAEVPIVDSVKKGPTIRAGFHVNVYCYDTESKSLHLLVENARVIGVLYSKEDLATISWTLSYDSTTYTQFTDVWEALKALAAGTENVMKWENYGSDLLDHAMRANILDFNVNAIYVVKVPLQAGEAIIQYEFYESGVKDVMVSPLRTPEEEREEQRLREEREREEQRLREEREREEQRAELEALKLSAISKVDELYSTRTQQAISSVSSFLDQIENAASAAELESILAELDTSIRTENKRRELLDQALFATTGVYYSATGSENTKPKSILAALLQEINSKGTLAELLAYEASGSIDSQATAAWRSLLNSLISGIADNLLVMKQGLPASWHLMSKAKAQRYVGELSWQALRELDFEAVEYVEVPVSDTVNRSPTIGVGSRVNLYCYDENSGEMRLIVENAEVERVIYSKEDLAAIFWSLSYNNTTFTYATDVWEALKAAVAGSENAALVEWENYGSRLMENALQAGVLDFKVNAIYVVKVPMTAGGSILQYEYYETETKDVVIAAYSP